MSASGDGSTTIKIKFIAGGRGGGGRYVEVGGGAGSGGGSSSRAGASKGKSASSRFSYAEADSEDDEAEFDDDDEEDEEDGGYGESSRGRREGRAGPKRDRPAERARAKERIRLGIPPRSNKPVDFGRKRRRLSREGEEEEGDWEDNDLEDGDEEQGQRPARPRRVQQLQQMKASKAPRRIRLPDSFFQTRALRDSFLATLAPPSTDAPSSSTRRSSSRLAYAFGQRLPDTALLRVGEFELFGGVAGDESDSNPGNTSRRLEEMVVEREGEEKTEVWGGRVVPKSALEVERRGPIIMGHTHALNGATGPGAEESSASEAELAPLRPPPTTTTISATGRPRSRSSVSNAHQPTGFVAPRLTPTRPRRTSTSYTNGSTSLPLDTSNAVLPAVVALEWVAPGNESSSSLTSLQPTSADESIVQRGAGSSTQVKEEERMVLD